MDKRFSALDWTRCAALWRDSVRQFCRGGGQAVSVHLCGQCPVKKLEQQCGVALTVKQGRTLALTREGEILLSYARRMLVLNDEALRAIRGELLQGEVRLGMQEDFGESVMPKVLGDFHRQHPELRMTARVDRNPPLLRGVAANELDLALVWQEGREGDYVRSEPLAWICRSREDIEVLLQRGEPLPLVMFDAPCLLRSRAIATLDAAGIPGVSLIPAIA